MNPDAGARHRDLYGAINQAALVILVLTLLDKLLALAKEMLLARSFGIAVELDIFNLAYAVPGIAVLLVNGAFVSAFIPLYLQWNQTLPPQEVRNRCLTVLLGSTGALALATLAGSLAAPLYFPLVAYGLTPEQQQSGVAMERLLMLVLLLEGVAVLLAALLQAWKAFAAATLSQAAVNLTLILFLVLGSAWGIDALVWGTLAGSAVKLVYLLVCVTARGFSLFRPFSLAWQELRPFFALVLPLLGSALVVNSILLVDQSMASQLSAGGVSSLRYAYRINDLPLQVVVLAISRAVFPYISENAAQGDRAALRYVLLRSLVFIGLISFPLTAFVLVAAPDVVTVLLQRGAFDSQAATLTAATLRCYVLGLCFFAYSFINGAFFSALKKVKTLLVMGLLSLALNVALNLLFIHLWGQVWGIALSSSISSALVCLLFLLLLHREIRFECTASELKSLAVPPLAAGLAAAPCWLLRPLLLEAGLGHFFILLGLGSLFCLAYAGLLLLWRTPEFAEVLSMGKLAGLLQRLGRMLGLKH